MRFYFYHTPAWLQKLYPQLTWKKSTQKKEIYLTFDDGPMPGATEEVLKILDDFNASATFFAVGDNVRKFPSLLKEVNAAGHCVGNHTFNHRSGWSMSLNDYIVQVEKCENIIGDTLGVANNIFRPPYGRIKFSQADFLSHRYEVIMWQVLSGDFDLKLNHSSSLKSLKKSEKGDILVFHDSVKYIKNVSLLLPEILEYFSGKGFKFSTLK